LFELEAKDAAQNQRQSKEYEIMPLVKGISFMSSSLFLPSVRDAFNQIKKRDSILNRAFD